LDIRTSPVQNVPAYWNRVPFQHAPAAAVVAGAGLSFVVALLAVGSVRFIDAAVEVETCARVPPSRARAAVPVAISACRFICFSVLSSMS
jgi:hypothetical protein